jgi:catechol 2,3-dioxygenase-like lactoylglutathione lyase family enzyme
MSTIDHLGFSVADYAVSRAFYDKVLATLGMKAMMEFPLGEGGKTAGYGIGKPDFWISTGGGSGHLHIAFTAATREDVDAFHAAALAAGGKDNGAPGLRHQYHPNYYGAFVIDPDGHNIEAVCHAPA